MNRKIKNVIKDIRIGYLRLNLRCLILYFMTENLKKDVSEKSLTIKKSYSEFKN